MRLNRLTLQGYKSFATKTEFLFPLGIAAIVGPNGAGKSNVADAIRWALGEQSMRALRGKSTADMIFVGGRHRARAGMAEVSLTLDNSDGWLPIEFSEVTITRRGYRSGENEYLINGARVRLRDVAELLAESGLSQRAHTFVGQGLVDAALSLRPQERRALFDEAAGISLYRARREAAIQQLDEMRHNLERAYDIINEISPRLQRLEREVERVEEHNRVTAHLRRLQRTWYGYHWGRLQAALERALGRGAVLESNLEAQRREASALGERLVELRQRESDLRARLRDWHRESADLRDRANDVQRELAVAEERARLLKVRREELLAELAPLRGQQEAQAEQVARSQAKVEQLERERAQREARLAALERERVSVGGQAQESARRRARMEQELRARRAQLGQLNQALLEARAETARLASEQAVTEEQVRQLEARRGEVMAELESLNAQEGAQVERVNQARALIEQLERQLAGHKNRVLDLEREWTAVQQRTQEPSSRSVQVEQTLHAHRAQLERLNSMLLVARIEAARLAGEQEALSRMRGTWAAHEAGVQALLQASLDGVLGPLATLIQVPEEWERAVEAALGADLRAVVVERASIVEEVRRILESPGGRLTLLPLDYLRPTPPLPVGALRAADVVVCDGHVRPAVETVLGAVALCDDLAAAQALLAAMPPGSRCVTAAGVVLRADGALSVGQAKTAGVGFLAVEQARRELPARLDGVQRRCQQFEAQQRVEAERIAALEAQVEQLARQATATREEAARSAREALEGARAEVAAAEEALHGQRAAVQREVSLLERLWAQIETLRQQAGELASESAAIAARTQELPADGPRARMQPFEARTPVRLDESRQARRGPLTRLQDAQRRCQEVEEQQHLELEQVAAMEDALEALAQEAAAAAEKAAQFERETLGKARTDVAVAEETLRSQQIALQREAALLERQRAQISARQRRVQELDAKHAGIVTRVQELRVEAFDMEAQLRQVRERILPAEGELARLGEGQTVLEERERRARDRVRDVEARHSRAQLDVARCRDELKLLSRRIEEDLGLVELELAESVTAQAPLPLRPLVSRLPVVEELPEGLEEEIQRLKARLHRLGAVNPNAPDDYAQVQERHQFLTEQSADLEAASAQLRQVVAELDEMMETAFRETFDAVAERFTETFTALFGGGTARLELTEPDDLMSTGVDIVARPPGKRAQRLVLLSGGERALTAVALLFALLHISPTPFCVLDEVDAMLDEANVGRFRTLLEELAQQTQVVIITHNRATIEAADTMYGISMGADGISQVVSLKLD